MATKDEINFILSTLSSSRPEVFFKKISATDAGIGMVLKILQGSSEPVCAGEISKKMNVSTARVASLLNKMTSRGLIERQPHPKDKRITIVVLTEKGKGACAEIEDGVYSLVSSLIDELGMEKLLQFTELSKEIRQAVGKHIK